MESEEMNEITIVRDARGIYRVSDTLYGSSTTTDDFDYALRWGLPAFGEGKSIVLHLRELV